MYVEVRSAVVRIEPHPQRARHGRTRDGSHRKRDRYGHEETSHNLPSLKLASHRAAPRSVLAAADADIEPTVITIRTSTNKRRTASPLRTASARTDVSARFVDPCHPFLGFGCSTRGPPSNETQGSSASPHRGGARQAGRSAFRSSLCPH